MRVWSTHSLRLLLGGPGRVGDPICIHSTAASHYAVTFPAEPQLPCSPATVVRSDSEVSSTPRTMGKAAEKGVRRGHELDRGEVWQDSYLVWGFKKFPIGSLCLICNISRYRGDGGWVGRLELGGAASLIARVATPAPFLLNVVSSPFLNIYTKQWIHSIWNESIRIQRDRGWEDIWSTRTV